MRVTPIALLAILVAATTITSAADSTSAPETDRFIYKNFLPDGQFIIVTEGDMEPRSIGSILIRVYGAANRNHPTDDFICGIVLERDGAIETVAIQDLDGDGNKEFVVIARCVGTGGFLSAQALQLDIPKKGRPSLRVVGAIDGVKKNEDALAKLGKLMSKVKRERAQ